MPNQQLIDYIKKCRREGFSIEEIKDALLKGGWRKEDIEEAIKSYASPPQVQISEREPSLLAMGSLPWIDNLFLRAFSIYKERWRVFLGIYLIPVIFGFLGALLLAVFLAPKAEEAINVFLTISFIFYLFYLFLFLWAQISLIYALKDREEEIGIKESFSRGWSKLISAFWIFLLIVLINTGGVLLLIIPGIVVAVWIYFGGYILICENIKGMNALQKSREYVKGYWWPVFWRLIPIFLIFLIISSAESLFASFGFPLTGLAVQNLVTFLAGPLMVTYGFLLYSDLRSLKEKMAFVPKRRLKATLLGIGVFGLILGLAVYYILSSTPSTALQKARDLQRIRHLLSLKADLEFYFLENDFYPHSLDRLLELKPISPSIKIFKDPATNLPYEYQVLGEGQGYRLCAEFERPESLDLNYFVSVGGELEDSRGCIIKLSETKEPQPKISEGEIPIPEELQPEFPPDETTMESVTFGKYSAYVKERDGTIYLILEKNGEEIIIDEKDKDAWRIGEIYFSPKGNYLIYGKCRWQFFCIGSLYVYDVKDKKTVFSLAEEISNVIHFTPSEDYFYLCSSPGMHSEKAGLVGKIPSFNYVYNVYENVENQKYAYIECKYDENKEAIIFKLWGYEYDESKEREIRYFLKEGNVEVIERELTE